MSSGQADNDIPLDEQKAEIKPPPDGIEWQDPLVQFILTASLLPDEYQQFCEENLDLAGRANYTDGDFYAHALAWERYMAAHGLQVPEERLHQVFHFETWLHSSDSTVIELYLHDPEKGDIRVMPPGAAPTVQISSLDDLRHLPNLEVVRVAYKMCIRDSDKVSRGQLSAGHGRALLSLGDPEQMEKAAEKVVAQGMSVRETEKLTQKLQKPKKAGSRPSSDDAMYIEDLQRRLSAQTGYKAVSYTHLAFAAPKPRGRHAHAQEQAGRNQRARASRQDFGHQGRAEVD